MFEKASVDWNGRQVVIPVHVSRNTAVGFVAESQPLPGPGLGNLGTPAQSQGYGQLTANAEFLYGRFQITGPAMAAAGKGGANSFVGWVDGEMNRLVNDIRNQCNRAATSGGQCIGFVTHGQPIGPGGAAVEILFDGDAQKLADVVLSGAVAGVDVVDVVRLDTYASIVSAGGQITIAASGNPGTVLVQETSGVGTLDFAVDAAQNAIPCAIIANINANAGAAPVSYLAEPVGIYGNLGLPGLGAAGSELSWFGFDRTLATGQVIMGITDGAAAPTSNALSTVPAAAPPQRQPIQMGTLQTLLDRIHLASDSQPDVLLCNPLQRTRLAASLQETFTFNTDKSGGGNNVGDGGYTGFAFAGIPVKTSRHVDNGMMLALTTSTWKMLELEAGRFADEDGDVLSRVGVIDAYEGFYKWYYNVVCCRPNANGVITGLTL
jgi:hypothetical protein